MLFVMPLKEKISITLDEDIIEKTRILAENCDRTFSQYINLVLRDHLDKQSSETSPQKNSLFSPIG